METTTSNKIALATLGALLLTMALGIFSNAVFAPHHPTKLGWDLPAPAETEANASASAKPQEDPPLPPLLAKADVKKGEADTKPCLACHDFSKDGKAKVGPPLYGVVGRKVASVPGFSYSDTLKKMGGEWTYEELFQFIKAPQAMEPGTKMTFPGDKDPQHRADILAYLQTLSDSPVPFPQ
jgi:cytochrome c